MNEQTRTRLIQHGKDYPCLQAQDVFKYLFQSAYGCEHLVGDGQAALRYIQTEFAAMGERAEARIEPLDGAYSRVHLGVLREGLRPETLARLFCLSAKKEDGEQQLNASLEIARELVTSKELPLDAAAFAQALQKWQALGCPAIHHSETFRAAYFPAYRVIANRYADFLQVFTEIDKRLAHGSVTLVIEGGSASGKSTLADALKEVYGCTVLHADDYFLRPEQRTPERLAEVGGNFDRERFAEEIVRPLCAGKPVTYRRFDCMTQTLGEPITVQSSALTIVEGAYSLHPAFVKYADFSVFLDVDPALQQKRITKRNAPPLAKRFFTEWIPMELAYFTQTDIQNRVDLIIRIHE